MSTITKERVANLLQFNSEGSDCQANAEQWEVHELARIALASLEAEAVAFRSKLKPPYAGSDRWDYTDHRQPDAFELENCFIERLYTTPPAPVSVPDLTALDNLAGEMLNHAMNCERRVAVAYTHCAHRLAEEVRDLRAAMLQGADGNSPVIPDGWGLVPVDMTPEQMRAVQLKSELGSYAAANLSGTYSLFREFWDVAIAAAPQQEAKP